MAFITQDIWQTPQNHFFNCNVPKTCEKVEKMVDIGIKYAYTE